MDIAFGFGFPSQAVGQQADRRVGGQDKRDVPEGD